nr:patatin-like phospholipase family protein [Rickettsia endosymbiont of Ceutorhynchus assimilis]
MTTIVNAKSGYDNSKPTFDHDFVKTNRILSLSGGGVKGIAELVVLVEIEERTGKSISELFPIIAGTSVGGLIAALLTIPKEEGSKEAKYSAKDALEIFTNSASEIFPNVFLGSLKQIFTHKYSQASLKKILDEYLENDRLSDTTSRLIIPVTDLNAKEKEAAIFDSNDNYSSHVKVKDIILATTAAPTFFKPVTNREYTKGRQEGDMYAYADGGLGANRPAYEALKTLKKGHNRTEQAEILDHTMICSINFNNDINVNTSVPKIGLDGMLGWLIKGKLVDRLMQGNENLSTAEVKVDLPGEDEFIEISIPITKETKSLDNANSKNIENLIAVGQKYIAENSESIQKLCDNLLDNINKEQGLNTTESLSEITSDNANIIDVSDDEEGVDKEQVLTIIQEYAEAFCEKNPLLKENIDKFFNALKNYTYDELEKLVLNFNELGDLSENELEAFVTNFNMLENYTSNNLQNLILNLSETTNEISNTQNNFTPFTSCSMEALKEDSPLEGIDIETDDVYA